MALFTELSYMCGQRGRGRGGGRDATVFCYNLFDLLFERVAQRGRAAKEAMGISGEGMFRSKG